MTVAVVSAIYGGYDLPPPPPEQDVDATWILVTDEEYEADGWTVVVEPRPVHPRLAAKWAKCLTWNYVPDDCTTSVWLDGACRLLQPSSLRSILHHAGPSRLAQITHPWRDCIYDEADASHAPKYEGLPVHEQVDHYRDEGHPEHFGLWATGLIVRNAPTQADRLDDLAFGAHWLAEQYRWTYQDQLSQAPLLRWHRRERPFPLPFPLHGSGLLEWANHRHAL